MALVCAMTVGAGFAAWTRADGDIASSTEVYDALSETPGTSGFWDKSGYSGSLNSIGIADCAVFVIGAGAASDVSATAGEKGFEPFSAYAMESSARSLDSREPRGLFIQIY